MYSYTSLCPPRRVMLWSLASDESVLMHHNLPEVSPIDKHPKSETLNALLRQHIQQMCRIGKMNVVIRAAMREKEADFIGMEAGDIAYRGRDVAFRVERGQIHVTFSVYRV